MMGKLLPALLASLLVTTSAQAQSVPQGRDQIRLSYAPVVKQTAPAVVNIFAKKIVRQQAQLSPLFNDPFFRQFFGDQLRGLNRERVENSLGSGVLVRADGTIVTNYHVIDSADQIRVVLADRREFDATLVRSDKRTDLAVLKINGGAEKLPYLEFRDSDDLEVGDLVLAVGNPFGVGQTVTSGIVSALARTNAGVADYRFFIQTDAAINPGNSGGALVTMDGRLVGINSAIYSQSGGSVGIGFAIPANMVRTVVDSTSTGNRIIRPWFGASGQAVTSDLAASLGLKHPIGVLVGQVFPGGPADQAGIKTGDVVVEVNGREVDDPDALRFRVATQNVGGTARLKVLRQNQERAVSLPLQTPPETPPRDLTPISGNNPLSGATIANLSPAYNEELGLATELRGVVIVETQRGSIVQNMQLQPGDIIQKVNERDVGTVRQLVEAVGQQAPRGWRVIFKRGDQTLTLQVKA